MPEKRYIVGGRDGWLRVKVEPAGEIYSVPEYLEVDLTSTRNGRDFITLLEGTHKGRTASVATGNLSAQRPEYKAAAHVTFSLSQEMLTYPLGTVRAVTYPGNPISEGLHPIQIPDHPHAGGLIYAGRSAYAKTWFYLGRGVAVPHRSDRYLHTGERSAGCITVDPAGWTQLYRYLILCRSHDGKHIGSVAVVR